MNKKHDLTEFSATIRLLEHTEPGSPSSKERVYNRLMFRLENNLTDLPSNTKEVSDMKNRNWKSKIIIASVALCLGGVFSTTSYAQELFHSVAARFQIGNMTITKYEKELPPVEANPVLSESADATVRVTELPVPAKLTVDETRTALGLNFPAPSWLGEYEYVTTVLHGTNMAEVQFRSGDKTVNFLISKGGENGIQTTGEVRTELIGQTKVYYANGIVLWESGGFTVEMYSQNDFDSVTLGKIISGFAVGAPVKALSTEEAAKNVQAREGARAAQAAAPAQ